MSFEVGTSQNGPTLHKGPRFASRMSICVLNIADTSTHTHARKDVFNTFSACRLQEQTGALL